MSSTRFFSLVLGLAVCTRPGVAGASPQVHTQSAAPISPTTATLNGMVLPAGENTIAWFEWGTSGQSLQSTAPVNVGSGLAVQRISTTISNLSPFATFQCRLIASNQLGLTTAPWRFFTSGQRVTQWGATSDGQMPVASGLSNTVAISAGHFHSLALTADGRVVAWGQNSEGQSLVPDGLGAVTAIAAGGYFNVVLKPDGTVLAWGKSSSGQTNVPTDLTNVIAISGGYDHSVALTADGHVRAWGDGSWGQTNVPAGLSNMVAVAAGGFHSLALHANGTVTAWGGQTSVPPGLSNVVAISAGLGNNYALQSDGTVVAWPDSNSVPAGLVAESVDGGGYHSLVLLSNRTLTAWGIDYVGITNVPAGLTNVAGISAGGYHSLALGNLPPQALPQHRSGVAGQDLTIQLNATDANSDELSYRITQLPVSGVLHQWTPAGRGSPILATGTAIQDPGRRVILEQISAVSEVFSFAVNDGQLDSADATVQVDSVPARAFTYRPLPAGVAAMKLNGMVLSAIPAHAWFEWGEANAWNQSTTPSLLAGDGSLTYLTAVISNLAERANFQCRLVISNAYGVATGMPVRFTTGRRLYAWGSNANGQSNVPLDLTNAVFTAAGWHNSFALRADGAALGWGWNSLGQATPSVDLTNAVDVAAGYYHGLGLRADGTVVTWGNDSWGQGTVPLGLTNVIEVAAGYAHSMALRSDGTVVTWGQYGGVSQTNQPPDLTNAVAIAGSLFCDLALRADGTVVSWGTDNGGGVTIVPNGLMNVVSLAAGEYHALALKADGTVVAWGRNTSGQSTVPPGLTNVIAISAGGNQSVALTTDGRIVAWGSITNAVSGLTNVVQIANGSGHGLALGNLLPRLADQHHSGLVGADLTLTLLGTDPDNDALRYRITTLPTAGSLYQWTAGGRGEPISTNNTWVTDPAGRLIYARPVAGGDVFTAVVNDGLADSTNAALSITIASAHVTTQSPHPAGDAAAVLCGAAAAIPSTSVWFEWGEMGDFSHSTPHIALPANGPLTWFTATISNLAPRINYQCRMVASNQLGIAYGAPVWFATGRKVVAWGRNNFNQASVPGGMGEVFTVAGGVNHNLALRANGNVVGWGLGINGETNVPPGLTNVVTVDAGANHSLALRADGTVVAWGRNLLGETNVPPDLTNVVAIAAGYNHSLALKSDGTVTAWGANTFEQWPAGQTNIPPGLSNVISVAAGGGHNLALKSDGTLVSWGLNTSGQTTIPATATNVVAIAAGRSHSLALRTDGRVVGWGSSRILQTTIPAAASNIVAIAAGENHSLALRADGALLAWGENSFGQCNPAAGLQHAVALTGGGFHSLTLANQPPQATSQTNTGFAAQDMTLFLPATDPNEDTITRRVVALPAMGTLYQWTPAGRGTVMSAANTPVNDAAGRVIFVPLAGATGWPYASFSFVANDAEVDSPPALATVNVVPAVQLSLVSSGFGANGEFSFQFDGLSNAICRVWASTNLTDWTVLGNATWNPPFGFSFTDAAATNWTTRFYRVTIP